METKIEKPWGYEIIWAHTDRYVGKILHINKSHRLSLQYHEQKAETIRVMNGTLTLEINGSFVIMQPGDSYHIIPKTIHRMSAEYEDVDVIEVSTPELEDVVRLQDDYTRATKEKVWKHISCPSCGRRHVDEGCFAIKEHRTHRCVPDSLEPNGGCGHEWIVDPPVFGVEQ